MLWYSRLSKTRTAAAQPPSYLEERLLDLEYAREFFYKDPQRAKEILIAVAEQLKQHHDDKFLGPIVQAAGIVVGNPSKASVVIEAMKQAMMNERKMKEAEDRNPWKKPQK